MKLVLTVVGLLLSQLAVASSAPEKCPEVSTIQAHGLHKYNVEQQGDAWMVNFFRHSFGTKYCWQFNTNLFHAKDADDAFKKAKDILASLHYISGPTSSFGETYACTYQDQNNHYAFATTPTFYECYD